jgi:hypothetical protein
MNEKEVVLQVKLSEYESSVVDLEYKEFHKKGIMKNKFYIDRLIENIKIKAEQNPQQRAKIISIKLTETEREMIDKEYLKKYKGMFTKEYFYAKKLTGGK